MPKQWFFFNGQEQIGPLSLADLKMQAINGAFSSADLVWADDMSAWVPASEVEGLFPAISTPPPPKAQAAEPPSQGPPPPPEADSDRPPSPPDVDSSAPPPPPVEVADLPPAPPPPPVEVADLPPAPPVEQVMLPAKSTSNLKVLAIVASCVILAAAAGVGVYAFMNRNNSDRSLTTDDWVEEQENNGLGHPSGFENTESDNEVGSGSPLTESESAETLTDPTTTGTDNTNTGSASGQSQTQTPSGNTGSSSSSGQSQTPTSSSSNQQQASLPTAIMTFEPQDPWVNVTVTFRGGNSTSSNPGGVITAYQWIFDDGVTGSGVAYQRSFSNSGVYVVQLIVTDDQGKTSTTMDWVTVKSTGTTSTQTTTGSGQVPSTGSGSSAGTNWWDTD